MDSPVETLNILLTQKQKAMKELESKISSLENDVLMCQQDLEGLGHEAHGISLAIKAIMPSSSAPPAQSSKPYEGLSLTDAIMKVLKDNPSVPGMTPKEIASILESGGVGSTAKDFYMSVYGICTGLVKQQRIREGQKDGRRVFMKVLSAPPRPAGQ